MTPTAPWPIAAVKKVVRAVSAPYEIVRQSQAMLPINPWKMHVSRYAAQTLTSGAYTTLLFDTVVYDSSIGYSTSSGEYTVPLAGTYTMDAIVNVAMPAVVAQQVAYISLFVNGVERRRGHGETYVNTIPVAQTISTLFSNSDQYNAGDVLTIQCWCSSGGANPTTPPTRDFEVYWTLHLISG